MTVQHQRRYARRLLQKIGRRSLMRTNPISAAQLARETERYLMSHAIQSAVLYDIWYEQEDVPLAIERWSARQQRWDTPADYRRMRKRPVEWHPKERSTSGYRKICSFEVAEKMWHVMARELICAQHCPRPHIGDWRGRGRHKQVSDLIAAIVSPEQAVVVADIHHAFESVNAEAIYELPYLPEPLIRGAIDHRTHMFVCRERSHKEVNKVSPDIVDMRKVVPSGLMEGSPASNAIFAVFLDDLPDHLDESIQVFVYCDNIILLAPNMSQAQRAHNSLAAYFSGHRAGPFSTSKQDVQSVTEEFEHLGYSIRLGDQIDVGLSLSNWTEHAAKSESRCSDEKIEEWLASAFPLIRGAHLELICENNGWTSAETLKEVIRFNQAIRLC